MKKNSYSMHCKLLHILAIISDLNFSIPYKFFAQKKNNKNSLKKNKIVIQETILTQNILIDTMKKFQEYFEMKCAF